MVCHLYKFECLTPLHVGSGEANYNIIDNEVERDPITQIPIVHASGLKGAFRAHFEKNLDKTVIDNIFGKPTSANDVGAGAYKFFDAKLLSRPMRVSNSSMPSISVTSFDIVNSYLKLISDFGCNPYRFNEVTEECFKGKKFLANVSNISVEDEATGILSDTSASSLKTILGEGAIAVAQNFNAYPLPVVAHNKLENGQSKNLWYEEFVPAGSVFAFMILIPDESIELPLENELIQIGANASIGYGYIKITKLV